MALPVDIHEFVRTNLPRGVEATARALDDAYGPSWSVITSQARVVSADVGVLDTSQGEVTFWKSGNQRAAACAPLVHAPVAAPLDVVSLEMRTKVYAFAGAAVALYAGSNEEVAAYIQQQLSSSDLFGPAWHIHVGPAFSTLMLAMENAVFDFALGALYFTLYKGEVTAQESATLNAKETLQVHGSAALNAEGALQFQSTTGLTMREVQRSGDDASDMTACTKQVSDALQPGADQVTQSTKVTEDGQTTTTTVTTVTRPVVYRVTPDGQMVEVSADELEGMPPQTVETASTKTVQGGASLAILPGTQVVEDNTKAMDASGAATIVASVEEKRKAQESDLTQRKMHSIGQDLLGLGAVAGTMSLVHEVAERLRTTSPAQLRETSLVESTDLKSIEADEILTILVGAVHTKSSIPEMAEEVQKTLQEKTGLSGWYLFAGDADIGPNVMESFTVTLEAQRFTVVRVQRRSSSHTSQTLVGKQKTEEKSCAAETEAQKSSESNFTLPAISGSFSAGPTSAQDVVWEEQSSHTSMNATVEKVTPEIEQPVASTVQGKAQEEQGLWAFPEPAVQLPEVASGTEDKAQISTGQATIVITTSEKPVNKTASTAVEAAVAGVVLHKTVPALGQKTLSDLQGTVQVSETRMSSEERTNVMDAVLPSLLEVRETSRLQEMVSTKLAASTGKTGWVLLVSDAYPDLNSAGVTEFVTFQIDEVCYTVYLPVEEDVPGAGQSRVPAGATTSDQTKTVTQSTTESLTEKTEMGETQVKDTPATSLFPSMVDEATRTVSTREFSSEIAVDTPVHAPAPVVLEAPVPAPATRGLPAVVPTSRELPSSQPKKHGWRWRQLFTSAKDRTAEHSTAVAAGTYAAVVAGVTVAHSIADTVKDKSVEQLREAAELGGSKGTSEEETQVILGSITETIKTSTSIEEVAEAVSDKLEQQTGHSGWHVVVANDKYADIGSASDVVAYQTLQIDGQYYTVYRTVTVVTSEMRTQLVDSLKSTSAVTKSSLSEESTKTIVDALVGSVESAESAEDIGALAVGILESSTGKVGWNVAPAATVAVDSLTEYTLLSLGGQPTVVYYEAVETSNLATEADAEVDDIKETQVVEDIKEETEIDQTIVPNKPEETKSDHPHLDKAKGTVKDALGLGAVLAGVIVLHEVDKHTRDKDEAQLRAEAKVESHTASVSDEQVVNTIVQGVRAHGQSSEEVAGYVTATLEEQTGQPGWKLVVGDRTASVHEAGAVEYSTVTIDEHVFTVYRTVTTTTTATIAKTEAKEQVSEKEASKRARGWHWGQWVKSLAEDGNAVTSGALAAAVAGVAVAHSISDTVKDMSIEQLRSAAELGSSKGTSSEESRLVLDSITETIKSTSSTEEVVAMVTEKLEGYTGQTGWHAVIADDRYVDLDSASDVVAYQTLQVGGQYYTVYRTATTITTEIRTTLIQSVRASTAVNKTTFSDQETNTVIDAVTEALKMAATAEEIGTLVVQKLEASTSKSGWHVAPLSSVNIEAFKYYLIILIGGQPTVVYLDVTEDSNERSLAHSVTSSSISGLSALLVGITLLDKVSARWSRASMEELWKATEIDSNQSNIAEAKSKKIVEITLSAMREYGSDTHKLSEAVATRLNKTHGGSGGHWVVLVADGFAQKASSHASRWLLFRVDTIYFTLFYTESQSWSSGFGRWLRRRVHDASETVASVGGKLAGVTSGLVLWHSISHETRTLSIEELRKMTTVDEGTLPADQNEFVLTLTCQAIREYGESTQAMDDWLTAQLNQRSSGWEVIVADKYAEAVKRASSVVGYTFFRVSTYYFTVYRLVSLAQETLAPEEVKEFALPNWVRSKTLRELTARSQFVEVAQPLDEGERTLALDLATRSMHAHGDSNLEMSKAMVRNLTQRTGCEGWLVWVTESGFVTPPSGAHCAYFVIFGYYFTVVHAGATRSLRHSASASSNMSTSSITEVPATLQGARAETLRTYIEVRESTLSASHREAVFDTVVQALHQHHRSPGKVRSSTTTYLDKTQGPHWHVDMGHSFTPREQLAAEHILFVVQGIHFSIWRSDGKKHHGWLHKFI